MTLDIPGPFAVVEVTGTVVAELEGEMAAMANPQDSMSGIDPSPIGRPTR